MKERIEGERNVCRNKENIIGRNLFDGGDISEGQVSNEHERREEKLEGLLTRLKV